jgi:hypothetical protein
MSTQDVLNRLKHPKRGLPGLLRGGSRKGAKTIKEALELLRYFELLWWSTSELWYQLDHVRVCRERDVARSPADKPACDRVAALLAVDAVISFLQFSPSSLSTEERRERFESLQKLKTALRDLCEGAAPALMLRPLGSGSGRRADVSSIVGLKGLLAGVMRRQQSAGMSRRQAAKWIVDNISPRLASRISRKPITPRMVEEWLDRYGGKHAEQNIARKAYLVWSDERLSPPTKEEFKAITEELADERS